MIINNQQAILFIEPKNSATSPQPLIDSLTRKMTAAFRQRRGDKDVMNGFHICACGVCSDSSLHFLPNGQETNSLCIHYLAYHRSEVPIEELAKVEQLNCGEAEPTEEEMKDPLKYRLFPPRN